MAQNGIKINPSILQMSINLTSYISSRKAGTKTQREKPRNILKSKFYARSKYTYLSIFFLLLLCCEAPRKNVLDPKSPDYPFGTLEGSVETYTLAQPLANARVRWRSGDQQTHTDVNGNFQLEGILPENGWLYVSRDNFFQDSLFIDWNGLQKIALQPVRLNALPEVQQLDVYSAVLNKPGSIPSDYFFAIELSASDADNDIAEITWEVPELDSSGVLRFDFSDNRYKYFSNSLIQVDIFQKILVYNFQLKLKDTFGREFPIGGDHIRRIIQDEIACNAPIGGVIINEAMPVLKWDSYQPGFAHTYKIEIFKRDGIFVESIPFWTKSGIPGGQTEFQMDMPLDVSEYTWVVWAVDAFKNRIRSSETQFEYRP